MVMLTVCIFLKNTVSSIVGLVLIKVIAVVFSHSIRLSVILAGIIKLNTNNNSLCFPCVRLETNEKSTV